MTSQNDLTNRFALVTITFGALFIVTGGQHLAISPRQTQFKTIGSGASFTCTLMDYDTSLTLTPVMSWQSPQHSDISAARGRVYTEQTDVNNLRLYITNIEESDAGQYTCTARLAAPTDDSENQTLAEPQHVPLSVEVKLFLYEEIQFAETPTQERNLLGSSALLQCVATGQPKPEVSWRFNRQRVISGNGKYVFEERGLRVNQLDLRDIGAYECRAEVSSHGNVKTRSVNLDVLYPPVIMRSPTADLVVQGRNASLQCRADGNPPVYYEWFREQKISEDIRVKVRLAEGTDTYVIKDVDSDDEGRYFCRVTNTFGTKEVHVDIRMLVMPKIKPSFPSRILLSEGTTLNISCEASGTPLPKIFWGRPGSRDDYTKDSELVQLAKSGLLLAQSHPGLTSFVVRNISRTFNGKLGCSAQSVVGLDTKNTTVVVEYKPSVSMMEAEQVAWYGQTRNFSCTADGTPLPTISWFHNDQYIIYNDTYSVAVIKSSNYVASTLTVSVDDDDGWIYGKYTCLAKNVIGSINDTAQLVEAALPDAPRNVSVVDEQSTSVTLAAVAPVNDGGMPVTSWRVQYEPVTSDDVVIATRRATLTFTDEDKMEISDLRPGATYTFYLAAGNALGYGTPVKFRVSTRRSSNQGEQLDVPDDEDSLNEGETRLGETVVIEKKSSDSDDGGVLFTDGPIMVIALGTGSAIVLIACVLAVMCTFSAARRRQRKCQGHRQHQEKTHPFDDTEFVGVIDSKPPSNRHAMPLPLPPSDTGRTARHHRCPEHGEADTCSLCRHDTMTFRHSTSANSCVSKSSGGSQRQNCCAIDETKIVSRFTTVGGKQDAVDGMWIGSPSGAASSINGSGGGLYVDTDRDQLVDLVGLPVSVSLSRQTTVDGTYCTFDDKFSSTVPKLPTGKVGCGGVGVPRAGSLPRGGAPLPKINHSPLIGVTSPTSAVTNVDLLPLRPFLLPVGLDDRYDVDPLANAAAINGYLSGENVDDDIDQDDFTIRMPSIDERMCDFVSPSATVAASWTAATAGRPMVQRN